MGTEQDVKIENKPTKRVKIKKVKKKKPVNKTIIDLNLYNYKGEKLTIKERRFIDSYLETGNIRASYLEAGYGKSKHHKDKEAYEKYANSNQPCVEGQQILNKPKIACEIKYQMDKRHNESVANSQEVMNYFTKVMRGEIQDQFGLDAPLSERTKAAQELAKRTVDIENKVNGKDQSEVRIVLDWAREE